LPKWKEISLFKAIQPKKEPFAQRKEEINPRKNLAISLPFGKGGTPSPFPNLIKIPKPFGQIPKGTLPKIKLVKKKIAPKPGVKKRKP